MNQQQLMLPTSERPSRSRSPLRAVEHREEADSRCVHLAALPNLVFGSAGLASCHGSHLAVGLGSVRSGADNMVRLGHRTVTAAMRYQQAQDGTDARMAAGMSVNALAKLAVAVEQTDADA